MLLLALLWAAAEFQLTTAATFTAPDARAGGEEGALLLQPPARRGCVEVRGPSNVHDNTNRIQNALDAAVGTADARGCVSVGPGEWYVVGVTVRSNSTLLIQPGARLVSKINVTKTAVVHIDHAEHVELGGGGGIHGHAEEAWSYFSDKVCCILVRA